MLCFISLFSATPDESLISRTSYVILVLDEWLKYVVKVHADSPTRKTDHR